MFPIFMRHRFGGIYQTTIQYRLITRLQVLIYNSVVVCITFYTREKKTKGQVVSFLKLLKEKMLECFCIDALEFQY